MVNPPTQWSPGFEHPELPPGLHWPEKPPEHYDTVGRKTGPESLIELWGGRQITVREYVDRLQQVLDYLEGTKE